MWRPEGWSTKSTIEEMVKNIPLQLPTFTELVEAGADAMLKALLDKGLRVNNLGDIPQGKGAIIFIPDEE